MIGIVTISEIIGELINKRLLRMGKINQRIMQKMNEFPLMV